MTREEKTNLLNELLEYEENNDIGNLTRAERREFQQWISEALEQEPILDKIRAEIEHIGGDDEKAFCKNLNESYKQGLKDALKVIDKYRAEVEPRK